MKPGSQLQDAIVQSAIIEKYPELGFDLSLIKYQVGIFGELKSLDTLLNDGDRVEIYRKLKIDPKEARRARAKKERALQKKFKSELKNKKNL